jgi:tetratricopeptide (TPR) repeat protein
MINKMNIKDKTNSVPLQGLGVSCWNEEVAIPTYEIGQPEKNPIFLEKRVYQGSSGVVYPYPVIEKIADEKHDKIYKAVFLENEYIKIMILPELGGRVQMAYDKIKQRHFIYYNQVIKPALVGLTGPWISGGIEFNWPQHHRPSTFLPVDHTIEHNADGSVTVWVSENEKMFHQKGMAGFTLHQGKAYLEIKGKLYNPTPVPQTFLWWANPAVAVNDFYQSVFPPDVHAVFDHGKRDVSTFPIATGTYYKIDYSEGVDISNYKNIPVPTSYMAINSEFNFVGGYENDTQAGVLHVANHHVSPGKKQWTWGNGDFGKAWDRNLTDEDGPYIELMAGVFTDNQPDFTWINPYEEKTFTQYFLPYRELGVVKNASQDVLMNMDKVGDKVIVKVFVTSKIKCAKIDLTPNPLTSPLTPLPNERGTETALFSEAVDLSPESVFIKEIFVGDISLSDLCLAVYDENGCELLAIRTEKVDRPQAEAAKAALSPEETPSCEQLYLTGLHLEQYRHATYSATDYYREALRRDPSDVRNNNAMGLWLLRRGKFSESETFFRKAIETQLQRNPNPYDGEPRYNLGLALQYQGKNKQAYDAFYKACWNSAMQDAGFFGCAQISCINNKLNDALYEVEKSLIRNWHNHKARMLKTAVLRKLGRIKEALSWIEESLKIDLFNFGCRFEKFVLTNDSNVLAEMHQLMRGEIHNYEIVALDYVAAGMYTEAVQILEEGAKVCATTPMTYYYMAWALTLSGKDAKAVFEKAAAHAPEFCFPNRPEAILALESAQNLNPTDAKAPYYLGNLWYDKRQYAEAISCWEKSAELDDTFPTVLRNLSLAYFNKLNQETKAVEFLEKAFALDTTDARILMELDQLYKRICRPHAERLAFLDKHFELVLQRDDVYLEYTTLCNQTGNYPKAMELIDSRIFHPWEGGEGKVPAQYQLARVELAKIALKEKDYKKAISLLEQCLEYPHNLGEGKLHGAQENDFHYWLGCAYEGLGEAEKAKTYWELAKDGNTEPAAAIFYNDQKPDKIFYQGLALLKLERVQEANTRFDKLIAFGEKHIDEQIKLDYFAVSLPDLLIWDDDLTFRNKIHCHYMLGLGYLGIGNSEKASFHLKIAANMDVNHQGVQVHLK